MPEHSNAPSSAGGITIKGDSSVDRGTDILNAALEYAALGHPVFPVHSWGYAAKHPRTANGLHDATTDPAIIRRWWGCMTTSAIGLVTGVRWDVLDIDNKPDGNGWAGYEKLRRAGFLNGAAKMVRTPSGGAHLYFPSERKWGNSANVGGLHLDFRGVGGYVVAPPSRMEAGAYVLCDSRTEGTAPIDWGTARDLLAPPAFLSPFKARGGSVGALADWVRTLRPGERNAGLYWAARRALEDGVDPSGLVPAAVSSGLTEDEATATLRSARGAYRTATRRGGAA